MRRLKLSTCLFLLLPVSSLFAQVQYSVGNWARYGNGIQYNGGIRDQKEYIENQTNVRLFWDNFTVGMQYLYDDPPEFGPSFVGVKKRYVEFANKGVELRAGDFYTLYGKGLAMNLFENRGINYDTGLDGLRGSYQNDQIKAIMAAGRMKYYDLNSPDIIEDYTVKSGHLTVMPTTFLSLGGSIVGVDGALPTPLGITNVRAEIPEIMMDLRLLGFSLYAGYASKHSYGTKYVSTQTTEKFDRTGDGIYGSLGYTSNSGFGFTFEYKDYRFDPVNIPETNSDPRRPTRVLPVQNPPIAYKEHSFYFLSRRPHVIDFNDEIGMQLDAFYALSPKITLNLNGSMSSRHTSWYLKNGEYIAVERENSLLPATTSAFSPFYELYAEVEWYFEGQSFVRAALNKRYDVQSYETIGKPVHLVSSFTAPVRIEYVLDELNSVTIGLEQQWFHDSVVKQNIDYTNQYISLTYSRASMYSVNLRMEFTSDRTDQSGRMSWITGELTYRLGSVHTASISYGTERGGLVCSSGICRNVLPFEGVRMSLITQL